ncbi:hypothetical protein AB0M79_20290 [Polymorphospora sp. NPDC051019]|uniref:hypothetical protein n=1 Tax=Polymorphospora sp. NPDC051019 TaxID=3155725 RepID=UPI0034259D9F
MKRPRIRSVLASVAACVVAATTFTLAGATPAAAIGQETFGCRIAPGVVFTWNTYCNNSAPASTYNVGFAVQNTSGSYTFAWSVSGPYQSINTGCTATSPTCSVWVSGHSDSSIEATVTYTQNGQSRTQTAYATINRYCGSQLC